MFFKIIVYHFEHYGLILDLKDAILFLQGLIFLFLCVYIAIIYATFAIWLNPFATVLFNVCRSVTVECCVLYPYCVGVFGMFAVM